MNRFLVSAAVIAVAVPFAPAAAQATNGSSDSSATKAQQPPAKGAGATIVITGQRLDAARDSIAPALGASDYKLGRTTIDKLPGGENTSLNNVLLQAPGVTQDSYGTIHVRNEHANLQYRLNGVIVPESISGFGSTFDQRIASSIDLITGTLPAQYGYRTSGVINFTTQSGLLKDGGEIGYYGGSHDTIQPSAMLEGSTGNLSYFVSGSYLHNDLGIENPLPTSDAIHDKTDQYRGFAYLSDILSPTSRISVFGGTSIGYFQIPDVTGVSQGYTVNGNDTYDAAKLDQNQREITHYAVAAYQYAGDNLNLQVAPFVRYSQTLFTPDPNQGDVIFNGFADQSRLSSLAAGVQADGSTKLGDKHTLRFGLFFQNEHTSSDVTSTVLPVDADGNQTSDIPFTIIDAASKNGQLYGAYIQDEWSLTPTLTLNYGARFDMVRAYTKESQVSPRANLVWKPTALTSFHIGYARNFTPPPQELIAPATLSLYNGTLKQPEVPIDDPVKAERESYFDGGVEQILAPGLKVGVDAYYKQKRNLLDEGQFGSGLILSPFNYAKGYAWGVELTGNYTHGPFDVYANLARGQEKGKDIVSSQYFFDADELAYIQNHYIYTDHTQKWTGSGGASVTIKDGAGTLVPSADFIYGSGLRKDAPGIPNGGTLQPYFVLNAGIAQNFTGEGLMHGVTLRLDAVNLLDKTYLIRDGTGVGVGAPQYGAGRGIFAGVSKKF